MQRKKNVIERRKIMSVLGIFLDIAATAALLVWFFMGGRVSDDGTALFLPPVLIYMIWSRRADKIRADKKANAAKDSNDSKVN